MTDINLQKSLDVLAALGLKTFPLYSMKDGICSCNNSNCRSPGKHPKAQDGFKSSKIHYMADDFCGSNVGLYCGESLIVLDVDKKDGGLDTLAKLKQEHAGDFANTWIAHTGGGGFHIYFRTDKALKTRTGVDKGIDIRANGGYVVIPPSNHHSGEAYRWAKGCAPWEKELAQVPKWLVDLSEDGKNKIVQLPVKQIARGPGFVDGDVDWFAVKEALSRITGRAESYNDWLEIGMCLHSTADDYGLTLWDEWSQASSKYQPGICAKKWVTFKSSGKTLGTLFHYAGVSITRKKRKLQNGPVPLAPQAETLRTKKGTPKLASPKGGLWKLADAIQETCYTPYDEWAIAAAVSTVSALVQGLYTTPTGSKLTSYLLIVGYVASGKNDYIRAPQGIVDQLRPLSLKDQPISSQGLRRILGEYPYVYSCADENISYWQSIISSRSPVIHSLVGDFCSIWGDARLMGQSNKKLEESQKAIINPHYSVFGNGTVGGFINLVKEESYYNSGLMSRFDTVLGSDSYIEPRRVVRTREVSDDILQMLKQNLNLHGSFAQGINVALNPEALRWGSNEVEKHWQDWRLELGRKAHSLDKSEVAQYFEVKTMGRLAEKALRYASIHCLTDGRREITFEDLEFGVAFTSGAREKLVRFLKEFGAENEKEDFSKKLIRFIKAKQGINKSEISSRFHRVDKKLRQEVLSDLIESGTVIELEIRESSKQRSQIKYVLVS